MPGGLDSQRWIFHIRSALCETKAIFLRTITLCYSDYIQFYPGGEILSLRYQKMSVADVRIKQMKWLFIVLTRKLSEERGKMRMKERKWVEMWVWETNSLYPFLYLLPSEVRNPNPSDSPGKGHSVIYTINGNKPDFHTWQIFNSWIKLLYFNLNCVKQISLVLLFLTFVRRLNELRLFKT